MRLSFTWLIVAVLLAESYALQPNPAPKPGATKKGSGSSTEMTNPAKSSQSTPLRSKSVPARSISTKNPVKASSTPASRTITSVPPKSTSVKPSGMKPSSASKTALSSSAPRSSSIPTSASPSSSASPFAWEPSGTDWPDPYDTLSIDDDISMPPYSLSNTSYVRVPTRRRSHSAKFAALTARTIPDKLYHATCYQHLLQIRAETRAGGTLSLLDGRRWPDDLAWSGGFYLTDDRTNALVYAAIFVSQRCQGDKGGPVVIEFSFDSSGLKYWEVPDAEATNVRDKQDDLGNAIQDDLKDQLGLPALLDTQPPSPPTPAQVDEMITRNVLSQDLLDAYNAFKTLHVIAAAPPTFPKNKKTMKLAGKVAGLPPIQEPFRQIILLTNTAMQRLTMVKGYRVGNGAKESDRVTKWLDYVNAQSQQGQQTTPDQAASSGPAPSGISRRDGFFRRD
ncbi:hypothetical protein C8J57DRAFT_1723854 [Mycena rebaudengoi]|nr:hypothetical protein C8J57DRAFT_1723854 [Mycena rebaudengoi]